MSFHVYSFLLTEGFCHTSDLKKYYQRLLLFAFISQIPFMLFRTLVGEWRMLNILFTLLLGLIAITFWEKCNKRYAISIPIIVFIIFLGNFLKVDYGWYGVACVVVLYCFRNDKFLRILAFAMLNLIYYFKRFTINLSIENLLLYGFSIVPVMLFLFFNGSLGNKTKYLYYVFYPFDMLILYGISLI